jgi:hypothetical protein
VTYSNAGGPVLTDAHVELVFWGPGWSASPALHDALDHDVDVLLAGPYLGGLKQYIGPATGKKVGSIIITSSTPPGVLTLGVPGEMLKTYIGNKTLPDPASDPKLLYMVIPQPGTFGDGTGLEGAHSYAGSPFPGDTKFHYGWTINPAPASADFVTSVFSHELVESMTDPEGTAVQIEPRDPEAWNEIADGEAQHYEARVGSVLVQSYWSATDHNYLIPTGQKQDFWVSGGSSHVLTVNGDQLAGKDDMILLDVFAGGVSVTLNGEMAQFGAGVVGPVTVNPGAGTNTVNVEQTLLASPVTINGGAGDLAVNISPGFHDLTPIKGSVTAKGGSGTNAITINDQSDPFPAYFILWGTPSSPNLLRTGSALITYSGFNGGAVINGGTTPPFVPDPVTFSVHATSSFATTINTGDHNNLLHLDSTSGPVTINTGKGNATVEVGTSGTLDGIGPVTVNGGPGLNVLNVHDEGYLLGDSYTLTDTAVTAAGRPNFKVTYGGVKTLTLNTGPGNDLITVKDTAAPTSTTINPGAGNDTVNVQGSAGPLAIATGAGNDTVTVGSTANTLTGIGKVAVKGGGNTTLQLNDQAHAGSDAYTVTNAAVTVASLPGFSVTYATMASLVLNSGSGTTTISVPSTAAGTPVTLSAGSGTTTLVGSNVPNVWKVTAADSGTLTSGTILGPVSFSGVGNLKGSGAPAGDLFAFANGATLSGTIDGQGGNNTLDFSAYATDLTFQVTAANAGNVADSDGVVAKFLSIPNLVGGAGNDRFVFANAAGVTGSIDGKGGSNTLDLSAFTADLTFTVTGADAGAVTGVVPAFKGVGNLTGGAGNDLFQFGAGASLSGTADGQGGTNTLSFAAVAAALTFQVTGTDAGAVAGVVGEFTSFSNLTGGTGSDQFVFSDGAAVSGTINGGGGSNTLDLSAYTTGLTFHITATDAGNIIGAGPVVPAFTGIQNLTGGAANDQFLFANGASVGGTIDGQGGNNSLDYSAYTSTVIVDLPLASGTGVGGNVFNIQNVTGGTGGGPAGSYNLLVGNGGNILHGGSGRRNLLIAGGTASVLIGGDDEDILIGGSTAYDKDLSALLAVMKEWTRTDEGYATRVANLTSGSGVPLLDATKVTGNGGGNTLTGGAGLDLFFGSLTLDTSDWDPSTETFIAI